MNDGVCTNCKHDEEGGLGVLHGLSPLEGAGEYLRTLHCAERTSHD